MAFGMNKPVVITEEEIKAMKLARQLERKRLMEETKMWEHIDQYVETFGKLPEQKIWKCGENTYEFYRVAKKVDETQYFARHDYDPDFTNRVEENPNFGKTYYVVYYKHTMDNVGIFKHQHNVFRYLD